VEKSKVIFSVEHWEQFKTMYTRVIPSEYLQNQHSIHFLPSDENIVKLSIRVSIE